MYLVLIVLTTLYGKRGSDLCAGLYIQQQLCRDMQGFVVLPIFVETVRLPTPCCQILRSPPSPYLYSISTPVTPIMCVSPQTRLLIHFTLLYLRSPHSFANTTDVRGIVDDQDRVQASHATYSVRFTHLLRTQLCRLNHRTITRCSVQCSREHV